MIKTDAKLDLMFCNVKHHSAAYVLRGVIDNTLILQSAEPFLLDETKVYVNPLDTYGWSDNYITTSELRLK